MRRYRESELLLQADLVLNLLGEIRPVFGEDLGISSRVVRLRVNPVDDSAQMIGA
ncbi:hypothetical protein D3C71_1726440 [compost metagenome]